MVLPDYALVASLGYPMPPQNPIDSDDKPLEEDEKKPLGLAPSETGNSLRNYQPLTGPELELTVLLLASHFQQCANYKHNCSGFATTLQKYLNNSTVTKQLARHESHLA